MKNFLAGLLLTTFGFPQILQAAQINYGSTQSTEATRNLSRNAANDSADVAYYNPAVLVKMDEGNRLSIGNQIWTSDWEIDKNSKNYSTDEIAFMIPSVFFTHSTKKWAFYSYMHVPGSGGSVKFEDKGLPFLELFNPTSSVTSGKVEALSYEIGLASGMAYAITDKFSMALTLRYVRSITDIDTKVSYADGSSKSLETTREGHGVGFMVGANYDVTDKLNMAVRYESKTVVNLKNDTKVDNFSLYPNNGKERRDSVGIAGIGASYDWTDKWETSLSYNYYFTKDQDSCHDSAIAVCSYDDDYDDGMDIAFGVNYKFKENLLLSSSLFYSDPGGNSKTYSDFEFALKHKLVSFGGKYYFENKNALTLGLIFASFDDDKDQAQATYKKNEAVSVGINYEFIF